ncbi:hypothetical protein AB1Y20_001280 [Prymnesium parvum]|uniref:Uncharacterized protein n=1 Tax=Prymnesium parvum TaxID=97485 RepID=A0AB34KAZ3_PRYPA
MNRERFRKDVFSMAWLLTAPLLGSTALVLHPFRPTLVTPHSFTRVFPIQLSGRSAGPQVVLVDDEGDAMRFAVSADGSVQMFDREELLCGAVRSVTFTQADGTVVVDSEEVDASFSIVWEEQKANLARLALLAAESSVEWFGDDAITLPQQVEDLLIDDELKATRPAVRILWLELLKVFPTEEKALAAVAKNTAIVLPFLIRPNFIAGSWKVLNDMMSKEEALEVVTQNPGVLASNPVGLAMQNAFIVKSAARAVDATEGFLDSIGFTGLPNSGLK